MHQVQHPWDFLIVTAANEAQAVGYRRQLAVRERLGLLADVRQWLVVADPDGRRVGSGGSTIYCLAEVLNRQAGGAADRGAEAWLERLRALRVLILHAGGDSRRLPAYGPCGKIFVPLPGGDDAALGATLFDRQLPTYLALPAGPTGGGQVVIASGDVLLGFSPQSVSFASAGMVGLGCAASPAQAAGHGVYCLGAQGRLRRFLQKPSPAVQAAEQAIDAYGQSVLDIGVIHFDAATAVRLLELCQVRTGPDGKLRPLGLMAEAIAEYGLDFYREFCCGLGSAATREGHLAAVRSAGSQWDPERLLRIFEVVSKIDARVQVLPRCDFLHFGTNRQIVVGGQELRRRDEGFASHAPLSINNCVVKEGFIAGRDAWVEGCRVEAAMVLAGDNLAVGLDVDRPLEVPAGGCVDVLAGRDRGGNAVHFVRCYHIDDRLHDARPHEVALGGVPLAEWLLAAGATEADVWDAAIAPAARGVFNARLFPAEAAGDGFRNWLWMLEPRLAAPGDFLRWRTADRYSLAEMATLADQEDFFRRRLLLRSQCLRAGLRAAFRGTSAFSAPELAYLLAEGGEADAWVAALAAEARRSEAEPPAERPDEAFVFPRLMHSFGSAIRQSAARREAKVADLLPGVQLPDEDAGWLAANGLELAQPAGAWADRAGAIAFDRLRSAIVASGHKAARTPVSVLRADEIVWGRAPARIDLTGGWTDTPPFSLEHGGTVLNAAIFLNGQPPVQVYARVTTQPYIRLRSIDQGAQSDIHQWEELHDYASAVSDFSLVKAALAIVGFTPSTFRPKLQDALMQFGGGLEVTTLAAIPKGSGLGTSSIVGATLLAVLHRVVGQRLTQNDLFHAVLRLEQALTTGGGWQDQIGGSEGGLKLITTQPGLIPEASIRYVPADVLDPRHNDGCTLLYYTGITRLAKNILQEVVGRYLDRQRDALATLDHLGRLAVQMADAMARKDYGQFGRQIDTAWELNKRLDAHSTNPTIDTLLARLRPHLLGAKLCGAGGGGFLFMACKTPYDARRVRAQLEANPPNPRARFFDFQVSPTGLEVSVC